MRKNKIWKSLSIFSISTLLLFAYTNCSEPSVSPASSDVSLASTTMSSATIELSPQNKTLNWGESLSLVAKGGTGPYFFRILSGDGRLDFYNGSFVAPSYDVTTVVEVTDSAGAVSQLTLETKLLTAKSLKLEFSKAVIRPSDVVTLTATGGTAPYTFFMISGVGSIASNLYTALSFGSGMIGVRDAKGAQGSFAVTVTSSLEIVTHKIYRYYQASTSQHIYDKSATSYPTLKNESVAFKLLTPSTYLKTVALRRCYISGPRGRFLSVTNCGAYADEGILGYVYNYPAANSKQLHSCFSSSKGIYLISTNPSECTLNGYSVTGSLGYVPL